VKWLSFITGYLRAAVKQDAIELWVDELLRAGANFALQDADSKIQFSELWNLRMENT